MDYVNVKALHLKAALKKEGKTMRHFNERLGKNRSFLSNVLTGSEKITRDELQVVADGLGTTVEYLMGETNDPRLPAEIEAEQKRNDLMRTHDGLIEMMSKALSASASVENINGLPFDIPRPPKTPPEEWGLGQYDTDDVSHKAEAMRVHKQISPNSEEPLDEQMIELMELFGEIARKPSAKEDLGNILAYMKFIARK